MKSLLFFIFSLVLSVFVIVPIHGQTEGVSLKSWLTLGLGVELLEDMDLSVGRQYGLEIEPIDPSFFQDNLSLSYRINRTFGVQAGVTNTQVYLSGGGKKQKLRYYGVINLNQRSGIWRIAHGLRFEQHTAAETRYSSRILYSLTIRPKSTWISKDWRLTPFADFDLYYNLGGNPISQYDERGEKVGKMAPYGFHRARFKLGVSAKPWRNFKLTLYGMYQREFNTPHAIRHFHQINVENPNSGNVSRAFSNYFVVGLSGKIYLRNLFAKSKDRRTGAVKDDWDDTESNSSSPTTVRDGLLTGH